MDSTCKGVDVSLREDVTDLEDKILMWNVEEEDFANHPLHTRIHNPYQYVFTCSVDK